MVNPVGTLRKDMLRMSVSSVSASMTQEHAQWPIVSHFHPCLRQWIATST